MAAKVRLIFFGISAYCGLIWTVLFVLYAESLTKLMCGYSCDNPALLTKEEERTLISSNVIEYVEKNEFNFKNKREYRRNEALSDPGDEPKMLELKGVRDSNFVDADKGTQRDVGYDVRGDKVIAPRMIQNDNMEKKPPPVPAVPAVPDANETKLLSGKVIPKRSPDFERLAETQRKVAYNERFVHNNIFINESVTNDNSFKYIKSNADLCKRRNLKDDVFLLLLILSAPNEIRRRISIRKTWANVTYVAGKRVETIFLLGNSIDDSNDKIVAKENELFRDICWKDFVDRYQNLTLKTITGFTWVDSFCQESKYVLKIDSDTVPNLRNIVEYLKTSRNENFFFEGKLFQDKIPVRDTSDDLTKKWYVPETLYPFPTYPPYLNGPSYLLSRFLIRPLLSVSIHIPYIPIEDVYVGMLMKTIGINPISNQRFTQRYMFLDHPNATLEYESFCLFSNVFTVYSFDPPESLYTFWSKWNYFDSRNCSGITSQVSYQ
ncbi:beta-1,3-galactosyltransferase 1-like [Amphiura filiformis]|uniref:beta-1,3-galactosyltransferase 1-like n=1 Tax=Amphiura filiformis TaxID=82378 RepID=UPI003B214EFD